MLSEIQLIKNTILIVMFVTFNLSAHSQPAFTTNNYYLNVLSNWTISTNEWSPSVEPAFLSSGLDLNWNFTSLTSVQSAATSAEENLRINVSSSICPDIAIDQSNGFALRTSDMIEPTNFYEDIYAIDNDGLVRLGRGLPLPNENCNEFTIPHLIIPTSFPFGSQIETWNDQSQAIVKTTFIGYGSYVSSTFLEPVENVALLVDSIFSSISNDTSLVWRWFNYSDGVYMPFASFFTFHSSFGESLYYFQEHQVLSFVLNVNASIENFDEINHNLSNGRLCITTTKDPISKIEIYNLAGQIITTRNLHQLQFELDTISLPKVFIIKVQTSSGLSEVLKIVQP